MIATDDRKMLSSLSKALNQPPFSVFEETDGHSALNVCLSSRPSLAILDCDMPPPDGIQISAVCLQGNRLPVILMSARVDDLLVQKAGEAGAMAYWVKSSDTAQLLPTVRTALRRFQEIQKLTAEAAKLSMSLQQTRSTSIVVGILMEKFHLSEKEAYDRLRMFARNQSSKISDITLDLSERVNVLNEMIGRIGSTSVQR